MSISMAMPMTLSCRPEEIAATSTKLECCITDMEYWMSANRLRLNMDKTELLWAGTRYHVTHVHVERLQSLSPA